MFTYERRYRGPIRAAIFDWAGTIVDWGSTAPALAFVETFRRHGVEIATAEARGPMGSAKRDHIVQLTEMAGVRARWRQAHGREPNAADVDALYRDFIPAQLAVLDQHSALIPGVLELAAELRRRQIRIGTTTGYVREMTEVNLREARRQGFEPDYTACASDVPHGRPAPDMALLNVIHLGVSPLEACVKVDDTLVGIEEGLNAGMWTVGVTLSGNELGLSRDEAARLPAAELARRREVAARRFRSAGAHYAVDSVADLLPCLDDIGTRLARGERP